MDEKLQRHLYSKEVYGMLHMHAKLNRGDFDHYGDEKIRRVKATIRQWMREAGFTREGK